MNMRLLTPFVFLFTLNLTTSQNLPEIIPPSPTAASLAEFADVPVSEYTGLPNIGVPIYTIKSGDLTVPINLNYHGGGIKAAQEASWVGLGWSLNAGGTVSRMIKGHDDFDYIIPYGSTLADIPYISSNDIPDWGVNEAVFDLYKQNVFFDRHDPEPDIFFYNFGGFSGKFIIEKSSSNVIVGIPLDAQAIKIRYYRAERHWIITDPTGSEYLFSVEEATQSYSHSFESNLPTVLQNKNDLIGNASPYTVSTWYLEEISSPISDHKITFEYDTNFHKTRSQNRFSETVPKLISGGTTGSQCSSVSDPAPRIVSASSTVTQDIYLSKIIFSNGYANFNTSDRIDMISIDGNIYNPQKLDNISVYTNSGGTPIVTADLNFDYFQKNITSSEVLSEYYRLKLEDITINDQNYQFDYNDPGTAIPSKMTLDVDHWGYFNNANNGNVDIWASGSTSTLKGTLIPTYIGSGDTASVSDILGADREPSEEFTKYFVLEKITLPTGGSQTFNWEANKYFSLINTTENTTSNSLTNNAPPPFNNTMISTEKEFEVTLAAAGSTLYANILVQKMSDYVPDYNFTSNHPSIKLYKYENSQWVNYQVPLPYLTYTDVYGDDDSSLNLNYDDNIVLDVGTYKMVMSHLDNLRTSYTWSFDEPITEINASVPGSGLRIESIAFNDGIDTIIKKYEYLKENSTITSGIAADKPTYHYDSWANGPLIYQGTTPTCILSAIYIVGDSNNLLPLSPTGDTYTGYSRVRTFYEGETDQGETISEYSNFKPTSIIANPLLISDPLPNFPTESDPKNGKPLRKTIKNAEGITVNETSYIYKTDDAYRKNTLGLYTQIYPWTKVLPLNTEARLFPDYVEFARYNNYSDWCYLESETNTSYDLEGNNPITTTTNYSYENDTHLQVTKTETVKSDGKRIITKMIYPDDVATASTLLDNSIIDGGMLSTEAFNAIKRLKHPDNDATGLHRVAIPIQTSIYEDTDNDGVVDTDELLSIQRTNYKDHGNDLVLPKDIQTLKGEYNSSINQLQDRILFQNYYDNGNLKEVSKKDGTTIVYIWGYNDEYPIAKIENATYASIEALQSFGSNFSINNNLSPTQETELRTLPKVMVTTYIYNPLVGVTSITDPRGYTVYYEYDDSNRLKQIKDAEGNILSQNNYNYKQ